MSCFIFFSSASALALASSASFFALRPLKIDLRPPAIPPIAAPTTLPIPGTTVPRAAPSLAPDAIPPIADPTPPPTPPAAPAIAANLSPPRNSPNLPTLPAAALPATFLATPPRALSAPPRNISSRSFLMPSLPFLVPRPRMFAANCALRLSVGSSLFLARSIQDCVTRPPQYFVNEPTVPFSFIRLLAFCIHFLSAIICMIYGS